MHATSSPFPPRSSTVPPIELRLFGTLDLRHPDGAPVDSLLAQPKRMALLAYLAVASPRGTHRRDRLLALFWPELDTERARAALRKGIHLIRTALGDAVLVGRGSEEVAIDAHLLETDVEAFESALHEGRLAEALALYRGDFLDGFHLPGVPEFERWVERERIRLRGRAAAAAWTLSEAEERRGDPLPAMQFARQALALSPDDEGAVRRWISLLDRMGDRSGALHAYESLARQLADDYSARPSAETEALILALRTRAARISAPVPVPPIAEPVITPATPQPSPRRRIRFVLAAAAALLALTGWFWAGSRFLPVTTSSREAYHEYQAGIAAYGQGRYRESLDAFERALDHDSTFAMAAFYASRSGQMLFDDSSFVRHYDQSVRLAAHARERERLLIRGAWADQNGDPAVLILAESLVTRWPEEPIGHQLMGQSLSERGDWLGAIPHFRAAIAADSAGLSDTPSGPCVGCAGLTSIVASFENADSLAAAIAVARTWVRRQPASAAAWQQLAEALAGDFHFDEAAAAERTATGLRPASWVETRFAVSMDLRQARFAEADRLLLAHLDSGETASRDMALWDLTISLRYQGRLREALVRAREYRRQFAGPSHPIASALPEAQVLYEMGRYREAAALFDSIASVAPVPLMPARTARNRVWQLTHVAQALAAGGDTTRLEALADTIESVGRQSAYGRDQLLHHYVRGLLWNARGRPEQAAAAFQRGLYSLTGGYSRNSLELAKVLLRLHRPAEAVTLLQAVLRGPIDASNYYATATEVHWWLGKSFEAAGQADSADTHVHWVQQALVGADPGVQSVMRNWSAGD